MITANKIIKMGTLELVGAQGKIHVGTQIVDPQPFGLRVGTGLPLVEKEHIGLDALGIENAGRQAQQGMHVAVLQQGAPNGLARAALEEHVIRHNDRRTPASLEQRIDMLYEVNCST